MSPGLQQAVQQYAAQGYFVVHQTENTAQLRKPKRFNFLAFIVLGVVLFIVGALVYAAWYASQQDQLVYLTVDDDGTVRASGSGVTLSTRLPRNAWETWAIGKSPEDLQERLRQAREEKAAPEYIRWLESQVKLHGVPLGDDRPAW